MFIRFFPSRLFVFFLFCFLKEPGMIHPPAGPTSSRIREEEKKK
jgi:hypothetical protein